MSNASCWLHRENPVKIQDIYLSGIFFAELWNGTWWQWRVFHTQAKDFFSWEQLGTAYKSTQTGQCDQMSGIKQKMSCILKYFLFQMYSTLIGIFLSCSLSLSWYVIMQICVVNFLNWRSVFALQLSEFVHWRVHWKKPKREPWRTGTVTSKKLNALERSCEPRTSSNALTLHWLVSWHQIITNNLYLKMTVQVDWFYSNNIL